MVLTVLPNKITSPKPQTIFDYILIFLQSNSQEKEKNSYRAKMLLKVIYFSFLNLFIFYLK